MSNGKDSSSHTVESDLKKVGERSAVVGIIVHLLVIDQIKIIPLQANAVDELKMP